MIRVSDHYSLHVGGDDAVHDIPAGEMWAIVHAAKLPWHKAALAHSGHAAPKDHPEYLVARRDSEFRSELMLNMIDVEDARFFHPDMIARALDFMSASLEAGTPTLCHCNLGQSRGPGMALLWLARNDPDYAGLSLVEGEARFVERYPNYGPRNGIRTVIAEGWPKGAVA